jgi:thiamine-phosphate pyrophosphorylase
VAKLYYITDRQSCPIPVLDNIKRVIEAGVDFVQIREKDLCARELLSLAKAASQLKRGHGTRILINDRLDIALAADLDGVHLAQSSISTDWIYGKLSKPDFLIGVSTHSWQEAAAVQHAASFITFGPVFFTPSKAEFGSPLGLGQLKQVCQRAEIPVFALGGINLNNYAECLYNGASGVGAIRLFQDPDIAIEKLVREVREWPVRPGQGP